MKFLPDQSRQTPKSAQKIFISYAREDEELVQALIEHLSLLQSRGLVSIWHDRRIQAGQDWRRKVEQSLESADIVLLLVSRSFLASEFCTSEMNRALQRRQEGGAYIIPVILRPVEWSHAPFSHLECLPKNGRAVTEWPDRDAALAQVAEGIKKAVLDLELEPGRRRRTSWACWLLAAVSLLAAAALTVWLAKATAPSLELEPDRIHFGEQEIGGKSPTRQVTLTNRGVRSAVIESVAVEGPDQSLFRIRLDGCSGSSLKKEASCRIELDFQPAGEGESNAQLRVVSNALQASPAAVLSGIGVPTSGAELGAGQAESEALPEDLRKKLRQAEAFHSAGGYQARENALRLFLEVLEALPPRLRRRLNQSLLQEAERDVREGHGSAVEKFSALFKALPE